MVSQTLELPEQKRQPRRFAARAACLIVGRDRRALIGEVKSMSQQQLQQIIQMLKAQPIAGRPTVQETRANFEQMSALFPVAADVTREPVSAGGVKAEWVTAPGADAGRAVLYLHGGGYV